MSNTRKVRRARKARERALKAQAWAEHEAQLANSRAAEARRAHQHVQEEWDYHVAVMSRYLDSSHISFKPKTRQSLVRPELVSVGPAKATCYLNIDEDYTSKPVRLETIKAVFSAEKDINHHKFLMKVHFMNQHKKQLSYCYSDELNMMHDLGKFGAEAIINSLMEYAKPQAVIDLSNLTRG